MTDRLQRLSEAGVSIWLDDLSRTRITSGNLAELLDFAGRPAEGHQRAGAHVAGARQGVFLELLDPVVDEAEREEPGSALHALGRKHVGIGDQGPGDPDPPSPAAGTRPRLPVPPGCVQPPPPQVPLVHQPHRRIDTAEEVFERLPVHGRSRGVG